MTTKQLKLPGTQNASAGKDLFAGSVAGAIQLVVGHPFDTVKVIMQNADSKAKLNMKSAVSQVRAEHGFSGFFRGIQSPLAFVALMNATMFTANSAARSLIGGAGATAADLTVGENALCGALAGVTVASIASPSELVKCRMQAAASGTYASTMDCARSIFASRGMRGMLVGMNATLVREVVGTSLMFGVYETTKRSFMAWNGSDRLSTSQQLTAGAVGGFSFWATIYPADNIKTRIQTDNMANPKYNKGLVAAFRTVIKEEGPRSLYRGLTPCLIRSMAANAVLFSAYEQISTAIRDL